MNIKLISSRWGELHLSDTYPGRQEELPAGMLFTGAEKQFARSSKGEFSFIFQELSGNVFKVRFTMSMTKYADTYTLIADQDIYLHFAHLYSHHFTHPNVGKVTFHQNSYNFLYLSNMAYAMKALDRFIAMDVILPKGYMQQFEDSEPLVRQFVENVTLAMPGRLQLVNAVASIEVLRWVDDIIQYGSDGMTDKGMLDEYVEQLLAECVKRLRSLNGARPPRLTQAEVEKIYHVSELIKDTDDPITITGIAKFTGLSINKLDKGFKYIFGHSVLHHRKEEKMRLALRLVADKRLCQKEVASILGYKEPQSFSRAFKARFGYAPYRNLSATAPKS